MLLRADPKEQTAIVVFLDGSVDVTRRPEHVREPPHGLWWSQPIPPGLRLLGPAGMKRKGWAEAIRDWLINSQLRKPVGEVRVDLPG
jgi:hypothetical protein